VWGQLARTPCRSGLSPACRPCTMAPSHLAGSAELRARAVFMGSPEFAVPVLRALAAEHDVILVVTQPDRPAGRGRALRPPPAKLAALELGIPVWQPQSLRHSESVERLQAASPDVIVVAAFGQLLPPSVLAIPRAGALNVHPSLLPRHRGASPVAAAILAGDSETGVTIMLLDEGTDTGPILAQERVPILPQEGRGELEARLAELGAALLIEALPQWLSGKLRPMPQDHAQATFTRPLKPEDGRIDWAQPAAQLERLCRAMDPWPGAFTTWEGRRLRIVRGAVCEGQAGLSPGQVFPIQGGGAAVATGEGALALLRVQLEGRPEMDAAAFVRGRPQFLSARLPS